MTFVRIHIMKRYIKKGKEKISKKRKNKGKRKGRREKRKEKAPRGMTSYTCRRLYYCKKKGIAKRNQQLYFKIKEIII